MLLAKNIFQEQHQLQKPVPMRVRTGMELIGETLSISARPEHGIYLLNTHFKISTTQIVWLIQLMYKKAVSQFWEAAFFSIRTPDLVLNDMSLIKANRALVCKAYIGIRINNI